jgi:hypothetical protein
MRVEIAKQRRAVATARARLAGAKVLRQAEDVPVVVIHQVGKSVARASRQATVALAEDGLYGFSKDGAWGARVRFAAGGPEIGDVALVAPPRLVKGGAAGGGDLPAWLTGALPSLPPDGILLQFPIGLTWFLAVPDVEAWFAALPPRAPGAPAQT